MHEKIAAVLTAAALCGGCGSKESKPKQKVDENPAEKTLRKDGVQPANEGATGAPAKARALPPLPDNAGAHEAKPLWATMLGGFSRDSSRDLAAASDGGVFVAGYFAGEAEFGDHKLQGTPPSDPKKTEVDGVVARIRGGKVVWARHIEGPTDQVVAAVAATPDDGVVAAGWFGERFSVGGEGLDSSGGDDGFVVKLGNDGRRLWAWRLGGTDIDAVDDVAVDHDGNIYITGVFRRVATFGSVKMESIGNADVFVVKLSSGGQVVWARQFGDMGDDYGRAIAVDSNGDLLLLGEFSLSPQFGSHSLTTAGNRDIFLAKLSPTGDVRWVASLGNEFDDMGLGLAVDSAGHAVIIGSFEETWKLDKDTKHRAQGKGDVFVARYTTDGKRDWLRAFGGKDEDIGVDVDVDKFGNVFLTGWFWQSFELDGITLNSAGKKDAFLIKMAPTGRALWAKSIGAKLNDTGRAVAVVKDGVVLAGNFIETIDTGSGPMTSKRKPKAWIAYSNLFVSAFSP